MAPSTSSKKKEEEREGRRRGFSLNWIRMNYYMNCLLEYLTCGPHMYVL
jgi:hypothetical protein